MKDKVKEWLDRNTPCGFPWDRVLKSCSWTAIFGTLWSLTFFASYNNFYGRLFDSWGNGTRILKDGAIMAEFTTIIDGKLIFFRLLVIAMVFLVGYQYNYHFQGSKSIYLMKRLPRRSELWRRCLVFPVTLALISEAFAIALRMIFFAYYMIRTPEVCLVPGQGIW